MNYRIESSPILQRIDIEPGMSYTIHAGARTRVACQAGSALFTQTIGWAGGAPIQICQGLHQGDMGAVESSGWILVQAGIEGARLRVELAPEHSGVLAQLLAWVRAQLRPRPLNANA
ncbi:hypothetical protein ACFONG_00935 [Uliginosibacterium paludis]|uniref:PilZ domain-containing protein n=1 Tax=Uliginosibacterium paludis TaxID=1615952 RepID=A0ABV2CQW6_9RHOO